MKNKEQLFLWNWQGGGFNSCHAKNRAEALKKGNDMTRGGRGVHLLVNESTLHACSFAELQAEDKRWGPFD